MNIIIESTLKTLQKSKKLLDSLHDEALCNNSLAPYHSSIGTHIRHILDFYDCIFNMNSDNIIDLTARQRSKDVECKCDCALAYLNEIMGKLNNANFNMNESVTVIDDLGIGKTNIKYTLGAVFAQANSHTIHHYAIINYLLEGLKISFGNADFGVNPTTPKLTNFN